MPLPNPLHRYRSEIEAELKSALGDSSLPLYTMMRYHLGWTDKQGQPQQTSGGKLSRPVLCLLACEAVGGDWHTALPAAAAIELIHNFSLIHDDIEDKSRQRHHQLAVWKLWGETQGINAGDAMYALAQLALLRLEERGVPSERLILISRELNQASLQLCEGQYLDIDYENQPNISIEDYLAMISKKTAPLFECSLYSGALLGTDNQAQISHLRSFGKNLGMAYQIQDDLLGIWGKEETTGKTSYSDIKGKKKTLPVLYALQQERESLLHIYYKAQFAAKDVVQIIRILDRSGARSYAEERREQYHNQCVEELKLVGLPSPAEQELREVADFLLRQEAD